VLFASPSYIKSIVGLTPREGQKLLEMIWEHVTRPEYTVRFKWHAGDIALWDNRSTSHLAPTDIFQSGSPARRCPCDPLKGRRAAAMPLASPAPVPREFRCAVHSRPARRSKNDTMPPPRFAPSSLAAISGQPESSNLPTPAYGSIS
jgi:hypothetical protein